MHCTQTVPSETHIKLPVLFDSGVKSTIVKYISQHASPRSILCNKEKKHTHTNTNAWPSYISYDFFHIADKSRSVRWVQRTAECVVRVRIVVVVVVVVGTNGRLPQRHDVRCASPQRTARDATLQGLRCGRDLAVCALARAGSRLMIIRQRIRKPNHRVQQSACDSNASLANVQCRRIM